MVMYTVWLITVIFANTLVPPTHHSSPPWDWDYFNTEIVVLALYSV